MQKGRKIFAKVIRSRKKSEKNKKQKMKRNKNKKIGTQQRK
jgi:hypothetical protein